MDEMTKKIKELSVHTGLTTLTTGQIQAGTYTVPRTILALEKRLEVLEFQLKQLTAQNKQHPDPEQDTHKRKLSTPEVPTSDEGNKKAHKEESKGPHIETIDTSTLLDDLVGSQDTATAAATAATAANAAAAQASEQAAAERNEEWKATFEQKQNQINEQNQETQQVTNKLLENLQALMVANNNNNNNNNNSGGGGNYQGGHQMNFGMHQMQWNQNQQNQQQNQQQQNQQNQQNTSPQTAPNAQGSASAQFSTTYPSHYPPQVPYNTSVTENQTFPIWNAQFESGGGT